MNEVKISAINFQVIKLFIYGDCSDLSHEYPTPYKKNSRPLI